MTDLTPATLEAVPFFQREISGIVLAINRSKTVALPPKEHARTLKGITLLHDIGVRIEGVV